MAYFHFTLGPVQSFVGQARRTRDFWAGSFLLSWLSGVAMLAVKQQGGTILFPKADEHFLNAISGHGGDAPRQGSLPNRFKAQVGSDFSGEKIVQAVREAWLALADKIYQKDIADSAEEQTGTIWQRQVNAFWDMSWVISEDKSDGSALDRRKNWRSHFLPDEPGIKCSLMEDWQELSGVIGVRRKDRERRETFWRNLYEKKNGGKSDFQPDGRENLCSIALIKRRFSRHFANFSATVMDGQLSVSGWKVPSSVPSVSYIAAAPWFAEVIRQEGKSNALNEFIRLAKICAGQPEYDSTLRCVDEASKQTGLSKEDKGIDGNMFHDIALDNPNICARQKEARQVKSALKRLTQQYGAISPFYAVLMMDGDSLGKQMGIEEKETPITEGLQVFTQSVPSIISKHNGFLIYAGGDDVLALLPLEDALPCAAELRWVYRDCFVNKPVTTSISAAIIYTHINTPLKNILRDAHDVLDHIAKDGAGRDALAVRVYKGSGIALQWAKKWADALMDEASKESQYHLDSILTDFKNQNTSEGDAAFSNSFFYNIRQRFALFNGEKQGDVANEDDLRDILSLDFIQSGDNRSLTIERANNIIATLLSQCQSPINQRIEVDGALLVRFLAQKGIERGE